MVSANTIIGIFLLILLIFIGFAINDHFEEQETKKEICEEAGGEMPENSWTKCYIDGSLHNMIKLKSGWKVVE